MIWKLRPSFIFKQLYYKITTLPSIKSRSNIIQRLSSNTSQIPLAKINSRIQEKYKLIDKISHNNILIYNSSMITLIRIGYHISYLIVIASIYGIYYLKNNSQYIAYPINLERAEDIDNHVYIEELEAFCLLSGLIVMNLLLFRLIRMHVLRMWYNPTKKQYTMCFIGQLPRTTRIIKFKSGDVKKKHKKPLTELGDMAHVINGKTYHFNERNFITPSEYAKILSPNPV